MHRLEEVFAAQKSGDAVVCLVVDQDCAEQRLLGLDVVRLVAEDAGIVGRQVGGLLQGCGLARFYHAFLRGVALAANDLWTVSGTAAALSCGYPVAAADRLRG